MNFTKSCLGARAMRLAALLQTASVLALAAATNAQAGEVVAQAEDPGDRAHHRLAHSRHDRRRCSVINLGPQDFAQTGAISVADLFRSIRNSTSMSAGSGDRGRGPR